jgi:polysaccharide deacetylase 2 family uncharacterized protein YibQ
MKRFRFLVYLVLFFALLGIGVGLWVQYQRRDYQVEWARIDAKIEREVSELAFPVLQEGTRKTGFLFSLLQEQKLLEIPFNTPLDRLPQKLRQVFSHRGVKVHKIKTEDFKDRYEVLMKLGWEKKITHILRFILKKKKVALLVDDFGYSNGPVVEAFLDELNIPLTVSIIPGTPYANLVAEKAYKEKKEIVVHLPMQPQGEFKGSYRWIVLEGMPESEIKNLVREAIEDVPHVRGLNNHMGSLITTQEKPMRAVLEVIKRKNLYFVDSRSSHNSVAFSLARRMGVKSARNDSFLDNYKEIEYIKERFYSHLESLRSGGGSVAICHATLTTAYAIKEIVSGLEKRKVELVFVSELVE